MGVFLWSFENYMQYARNRLNYSFFAVELKRLSNVLGENESVERFHGPSTISSGEITDLVTASDDFNDSSGTCGAFKGVGRLLEEAVRSTVEIFSIE